MIQDSMWNKISIRLEYIELRIRLNQFEMFVSSLIHEITLKTVLLQKKTVLIEKNVNIESKRGRNNNLVVHML